MPVSSKMPRCFEIFACPASVTATKFATFISPLFDETFVSGNFNDNIHSIDVDRWRFSTDKNYGASLGG